MTPKEIRAAWRHGHKGTLLAIREYADGTWEVVSPSAWPYVVVRNEYGGIDFKLRGVLDVSAALVREWKKRSC